MTLPLRAFSKIRDNMLFTGMDVVLVPSSAGMAQCAGMPLDKSVTLVEYTWKYSVWAPSISSTNIGALLHAARVRRAVARNMKYRFMLCSEFYTYAGAYYT